MDFVALSPDETAYGLSMVETRPWTGGDKQLYEVQAKLNAYLDFIESGELVENYPDSVDKKKVIILHCAEEPTGDVQEFLTIVAESIKQRGVSLEVWPDEGEA